MHNVPWPVSCRIGRDVHACAYFVDVCKCMFYKIATISLFLCLCPFSVVRQVLITAQALCHREWCQILFTRRGNRGQQNGSALSLSIFTIFLFSHVSHYSNHSFVFTHFQNTTRMLLPYKGGGLGRVEAKRSNPATAGHLEVNIIFYK
jgi:hypothetical protein